LERRNSCIILVRKPKGKGQLGNPWNRWEAIKMDGKEMRWENVDNVHLTLNRD
jgi:hypothetical protein